MFFVHRLKDVKVNQLHIHIHMYIFLQEKCGLASIQSILYYISISYYICTPCKFNSSPLKIYHPQRKGSSSKTIVFQGASCETSGGVTSITFSLPSGKLTWLAMENGPTLKMYSLLNMVIFQPAMLVYWRVANGSWWFPMGYVASGN